jgi:hypothetical protein
MAGKTKSPTGESKEQLNNNQEQSYSKSLKAIIRDDESLKKDPPKMMYYATLARIYEKDLKVNLELASFDLYEKYPDLVDTPAAWADFLAYQPVKDFITRFVNERAEQVANKQLANEDMKTSDAIKVKAHVAENTKKLDNSHIIVMLLPQ